MHRREARVAQHERGAVGDRRAELSLGLVAVRGEPFGQLARLPQPLPGRPRRARRPTTQSTIAAITHTVAERVAVRSSGSSQIPNPSAPSEPIPITSTIGRTSPSSSAISLGRSRRIASQWRMPGDDAPATKQNARQRGGGRAASRTSSRPEA